MSKFRQEISKLAGQKVRFFVGGSERGFVQGPIKAVEGDWIYIEKQGEIRGTIHTITVHVDAVRFYEIDKLVDTEDNH